MYLSFLCSYVGDGKHKCTRNVGSYTDGDLRRFGFYVLRKKSEHPKWRQRQLSICDLTAATKPFVRFC
jgi:hypothetical protein